MLSVKNFGSFPISVCMFIVSKALLISSACDPSVPLYAPSIGVFFVYVGSCVCDLPIAITINNGIKMNTSISSCTWRLRNCFVFSIITSNSLCILLYSCSNSCPKSISIIRIIFMFKVVNVAFR